jgi:hypothetical protein
MYILIFTNKFIPTLELLNWNIDRDAADFASCIHKCLRAMRVQIMGATYVH